MYNKDHVELFLRTAANAGDIPNIIIGPAIFYNVCLGHTDIILRRQ